MMGLAGAILCLVAYIVLQVRQRTPLSAELANPVVAAALQTAAPTVIHFHTGHVKPSEGDKPEEPNYRLLEKAGLVKVAKAAKGSALVSLTPAGERMLATIPGSKKTEETDGTSLYQIPVATRQFVSIASVEMTGVNSAAVAYNWKWIPNQLGDVFDAGGPLVKSFNMWERQTLIKTYQVDFYHSDSQRSTMYLARTGKEWKIATQ